MYHIFYIIYYILCILYIYYIYILIYIIYIYILYINIYYIYYKYIYIPINMPFIWESLWYHRNSSFRLRTHRSSEVHVTGQGQCVRAQAWVVGLGLLRYDWTIMGSYGLIWLNRLNYGLIWLNMAWYELLWLDMAWYELILAKKWLDMCELCLIMI